MESSVASRLFILPCLTAISSARMLTAISCGVTAPMVEADGRVHVLERIGRHRVRGELVVNARHLGAAADEAEVSQLAGRQRPQRFEVVRVPARDDDDVGVRRERGCAPARAGMSSATISSAAGKRSRFAKLLAIVDDVDPEPDFVGDAREMKANMAGADHVQLGRRLDRLDVHVHLAAADEPGFPVRSRRTTRSE